MATALVTGANRGIGLSFVKHLKARGDRVIAACRHEAPELEKLGVEVASGVDVTSDKSINLLAEKLKGRTLDVLINNAGLLADESFDRLDFASIQRQMEVNAYGPLRVSHKLSSLLKRGSKLALITSRIEGRPERRRQITRRRPLTSRCGSRDPSPRLRQDRHDRAARERCARRRRARFAGAHRRAHAREFRHVLACKRPGSTVVTDAAHPPNFSSTHSPRSAGPRQAQSSSRAGIAITQALVVVPCSSSV